MRSKLIPVTFKVFRDDIEIETIAGDFYMKNGEYLVDSHKEVDIRVGDIIVILLDNEMRFEVTHLSNNIDLYNKMEQVIELNFKIFIRPAPIIPPDYPIVPHNFKI